MLLDVIVHIIRQGGFDMSVLPNITNEDEGKYLMVRDGQAVWSAMPIKYVESLDLDNMVFLRDLPSGVYILYGKFRPYNGSGYVLSFTSNMLVGIITKTAATHVQVFMPANDQVQFLAITDDTYERINIPLNDLYDLLQSGT